MAIVSSVIVSDLKQADGRRWIDELHTDQVGKHYTRSWLCDAHADASAAMTDYATNVLWPSIVDGEIAANIALVEALGSLAVPSFVYTTMAQNATPLREAYRIATQGQAVQIGDYLNTLTDAQLMSGFGINQAQVTALRTNKLQPAAQNAAAVRATTGV